MSEAAKWYVIHTYSGYENKVAQNIEKVVENRKLHDLIHEVRVPTEKVTEITDGKTKEIERKTYPGYVLVKMIVTDDSWYVVRNTRGVTGFVGPGSKPVPLTDAEIDALGIMDADVVVMTMPDLQNFHSNRSYVRKDIEKINENNYTAENIPISLIVNQEGVLSVQKNTDFENKSLIFSSVSG